MTSSFIDTVKFVPIKQRMEFVRKHLDELAPLRPYELSQIGSLLCEASSSEARAKWPIIGDRGRTEQDKFERSLVSPIDLNELVEQEVVRVETDC